MTNHDKTRIRKVLLSLQKAKEDMGTVELYLQAGEDKNPIDIVDVAVAAEHIDVAIERLEAKVNST